MARATASSMHGPMERTLKPIFGDSLPATMERASVTLRSGCE